MKSNMRIYRNVLVRNVKNVMSCGYFYVNWQNTTSIGEEYDSINTLDHCVLYRYKMCPLENSNTWQLCFVRMKDRPVMNEFDLVEFIIIFIYIILVNLFVLYKKKRKWLNQCNNHTILKMNEIVKSDEWMDTCENKYDKYRKK